MRAVICHAHGAIANLTVEDIAEPHPAPDEIVVDIDHVSLNFHETLVIAGNHVVRADPPFSPGSEFCGTVVALGRDVTRFQIGERVAGNNDYGAARERLAFPAWRLCHVPEALPPPYGAVVRVAYGTSYYALKQRAALRAGETLAVLGASGGVGIAAVELGKLMGARVIACTSSRGRAAFAKERGADEVIVYGETSIKDELRRLTDGNGADVIYDPVGGALSEQAFRSIAWNGRHLVVGFAQGDIPRIPLNLPLVKNAGLLGVFLGTWMQRSPEESDANLAQLFQWVIDGSLRPHIQHVLPLEQTAAGLEMLASRQAQGKIVIAL